MKLVHQVWIGPSPIPPRLATYCAKIREAFPAREYKLWGEGDMEELADKALLPHIVRNADEVHSIGLRSDVVRLEILRQYGGIYLDTDFEPLRDDLEPLFDHGDTFLYSDEKPGKPLNGLMSATTPGHSFVELYLRRIDGNMREEKDEWDPIRISGPERLAECLNFWIHDWRKAQPIRVNDRQVGSVYGNGAVSSIWNEIAYPYGFGSKESYATFDPGKYPAAWLVHHWEGSWRQKK